jgi:hypothetical protein
VNNLEAAVITAEKALARLDKAIDRVSVATGRHADARARLEAMEASSIEARRLAWKAGRASSQLGA